VKGEGKTFTAVNLALTMARDFSKRVVLMDVDCRKSVVLRLTGQDEHDNPGWSDVVSRKSALKEILVSFGHEKLFLLPLGRSYSPSSNLITHLGTSELLKELRSEFDYVVLDAPPILPVADMRLLEDLVDGIIMVTRAEITTTDVIKKAINSLKKEKIIGFVLNDVKQMSKHYNYYVYQKHNNGNHV
jgi:capsular exopolysaccharide synthesis family protein